MSVKRKVLVVEDDARISSLLQTMLDLSDYQPIIASTGKEALMAAMSSKPDLILLDLGLPDLDGMQIIEKIRGWSSVPILVVSARTDEKDKIAALDAGADDYLCKPFSVDELAARMRVMFRHASLYSAQKPSSVFVNGDLSIDYAAQRVMLDGEELHLTPIEYRLLVLFSKNVDKVLTHPYITMEIWGSSWDSDLASLRVYMTMLRKKLHHRFIATSFGVGYRMVEEGIPSVQQVNPAMQ